MNTAYGLLAQCYPHIGESHVCVKSRKMTSGMLVNSKREFYHVMAGKGGAERSGEEPSTFPLGSFHPTVESQHHQLNFHHLYF